MLATHRRTGSRLCRDRAYALYTLAGAMVFFTLLPGGSPEALAIFQLGVLPVLLLSSLGAVWLTLGWLRDPPLLLLGGLGLASLAAHAWSGVSGAPLGSPAELVMNALARLYVLASALLAISWLVGWRKAFPSPAGAADPARSARERAWSYGLFLVPGIVTAGFLLLELFPRAWVGFAFVLVGLGIPATFLASAAALVLVLGPGRDRQLTRLAWLLLVLAACSAAALTSPEAGRVAGYLTRSAMVLAAVLFLAADAVAQARWWSGPEKAPS